MAMQDHAQHDQTAQTAGKFWTSRAFVACAILLVVAGFLLWTEHLAHAPG